MKTKKRKSGRLKKRTKERGKKVSFRYFNMFVYINININILDDSHAVWKMFGDHKHQLEICDYRIGTIQKQMEDQDKLVDTLVDLVHQTRQRVEELSDELIERNQVVRVLQKHLHKAEEQISLLSTPVTDTTMPLATTSRRAVDSNVPPAIDPLISPLATTPPAIQAPVVLPPATSELVKPPLATLVNAPTMDTGTVSKHAPSQITLGDSSTVGGATMIPTAPEPDTATNMAPPLQPVIQVQGPTPQNSQEGESKKTGLLEVPAATEAPAARKSRSRSTSVDPAEPRRSPQLTSPCPSSGMQGEENKGTGLLRLPPAGADRVSTTPDSSRCSRTRSRSPAPVSSDLRRSPRLASP
jgi:hypothetical protein